MHNGRPWKLIAKIIANKGFLAIFGKYTSKMANIDISNIFFTSTTMYHSDVKIFRAKNYARGPNLAEIGPNRSRKGCRPTLFFAIFRQLRLYF